MPTGWRPDDVTKTNPMKLLKTLITIKNMIQIKIKCFCFGVAFN